MIVFSPYIWIILCFFACLAIFCCCHKLEILNNIIWHLWKSNSSPKLSVYCHYCCCSFCLFSDFTEFYKICIFWYVWPQKPLRGQPTGQLMIRERLPQMPEPISMPVFPKHLCIHVATVLQYSASHWQIYLSLNFLLSQNLKVSQRKAFRAICGLSYACAPPYAHSWTSRFSGICQNFFFSLELTFDYFILVSCV